MIFKYKKAVKTLGKFEVSGKVYKCYITQTKNLLPRIQGIYGICLKFKIKNLKFIHVPFMNVLTSKNIFPFIFHIAFCIRKSGLPFPGKLIFVAKIFPFLVLDELGRGTHALVVDGGRVVPAIETAVQIRPAFDTSLLSPGLGPGKTLPGLPAGMAFFHLESPCSVERLNKLLALWVLRILLAIMTFFLCSSRVVANKLEPSPLPT